MTHPLRIPLLAIAAGAAVLLVGPVASAETVKGALEAVAADGATVSIGGKTLALSASRTNICVAGVCDQGPAKLKPGMACIAETLDRDGRSEARRLSCK